MHTYETALYSKSYGSPSIFQNTDISIIQKLKFIDWFGLFTCEVPPLMGGTKAIVSEILLELIVMLLHLV